MGVVVVVVFPRSKIGGLGLRVCGVALVLA